MKRILLLMLVGIAPLSARAALPGPLLDAAWLMDNLESVVLLDARKQVETFGEGHIPGARLVDVNRIRIDRVIDGKTLINMRPDPDTFQQAMRDLGVDNISAVVITHPGDTPGQVAGAARLYWHFKYYGFDNVALLDGGNRSWAAELGELVTDVEPARPGNYEVGSERSEIVATMTEVRAALDNDSVTLVDTRDFRYHVGLDKKDYVFAYGHIPGSRSLPYKFLNPARASTRYFDREVYVKLLDSLHIDADDELILYCNSAYEASSDWFVLHEILGKDRVSIYDASLHQWTQYPSNPVTTRLTD